MVKETVYCDRCGKQLATPIITCITPYKYRIFHYKKADLCKECYEDLKKWFEAKKQ